MATSVCILNSIDLTAPLKICSRSTGRRSTKAQRRKRDALIEQHIDWARSIAVKVASKLPTWFHADDLEGLAAIALLNAAEKYDAGRGVPFRAYARLAVEGACYSAARRNEYRERQHAELPDDEAADSQTSEQPETLPAEVWNLPPDQFHVVELVYLHGLTVEGAAVRMRIPASKASQLHRTALNALREVIAKPS